MGKVDELQHMKPIKGSLNTIAGDFAWDGTSNSPRKKYTPMILSVSTVEAREKPKKVPAIIFTDKDAEGISPHQHDLVVISITTSGYQISCVLLDGGSSTIVIFWTCFEALGISKDLLQLFHGTLVGCSGEQIELREYLDLGTTFGEAPIVKTVRLTYMVVDTDSPYSVIIGRPTLNSLGAVVSYTHLYMKFPTDGKVGVV